MPDAFQRLHRNIQRVLWDMKWMELRKLQVDSIHAWFDSDADIILSANTAAGKTEAAFLPILSSVAEQPEAASVQALYVGPLKALINDQFRRVEDLCQRSGIPVHRWHGDVSASKKSALLKKPSGVLLITPESLEALFLRQNRALAGLFGGLRAVVIDEMHVFLDSERGVQLQSLLGRLDFIRRDLPRARRVGLSATLGDYGFAKRWVRAAQPDTVQLVSDTAAKAVRLSMKTFFDKVHVIGLKRNDDEGNPADEELQSFSSGTLSTAEHILKHFYGKTGLVFCNAKADVEELSDLLKRLCQRRNLPDRFVVHHGSLNKAIREEAEELLQSGTPCTAICSSTLELGIDIGDVELVGQIGAPFSVSSLKQRLGRSGRSGEKPSILYMYLCLRECDEKTPLPDRIYPELLQGMALIDLMFGKRDPVTQAVIEEKWVEPPQASALDFSTLIQQLLSLIAQYGGIQAQDLFRHIKESGAFTALDVETFKAVLKDLARSDYIEQVGGGEIILGLIGEQLVNHYEFYAAFASPETYQVCSKKEQIGTVSAAEGFYQPKQFMLLAGKRWKIMDVDEEKKTIWVILDTGHGKVRWDGGGGIIHERVRQRMRDLLLSDTIPAWLAAEAHTPLAFARQQAARYDLSTTRIVSDHAGVHLFVWGSTRQTHTLELLFRAAMGDAVTVQNDRVCLTFCDASVTQADILFLLKSYRDHPITDEDLVKHVYRTKIPPVGKYGGALAYDLRAKAYAAEYLSQADTLRLVEDILCGENVH